jgi:DNA repair exonuclease SbcCD nuclease subunit
MGNRRLFVKNALSSVAAINLLPSINLFAGTNKSYQLHSQAKSKLRFAIASDGHYGQPNTDSDKFFADLMGWLNREHDNHHLDFVIINGDIVHDRPDLLKKVKTTYFDTLKVPYYATVGNHDYADAAIWKDVFGYDDNYTFEFEDIGFILASTSNTKGEYICPNNQFLKEKLADFSNKKTVFVVLHIPPHKWLEQETFFTECPDTLALLHSYTNIKAVLHGHDHNLDIVRYTQKLPHIFDGHFGGNWGTAYKGYRIIEVGVDNKMYTYQVNASKNPIINDFTS